MAWLRSTSRLMLFTLSTGAIVLAWALGSAIARSGRRPALRRRAMRSWARAVTAIAGMRVTVRGTPPRPPFLLVANHLGYMDIVALATLVDAVFVARGDLSRWPVLGPLSRSVGTIFVDRERRTDVMRVSSEIRAALGSGEGVVLFPEGTSTGGADVAPFRSSLLEPAVAAGVPVFYASLAYRTPPGEPPAHHAVCWWGAMRFASHLARLFRLPSFDAEVHFGGAPVSASDRKELATRLWRHVREIHTPTASGEAL